MCWIVGYEVWLPVFVFLWKMEAGSVCVKVSITGWKRELMTRSCAVDYYVTISIFGYVAPDYEVFIKQEVFKIWLYICLNSHAERIHLAPFTFLARLVLPNFARLFRKRHDFRKKMFFTRRVSWFSLQLLFGTFTNQEDSSEVWIRQVFWNCFFFLFYPNLNTLSRRLPPIWIVTKIVQLGQTHDEASSLFSQLRERARKKESYVWSCSICYNCDETDVL